MKIKFMLQNLDEKVAKLHLEKLGVKLTRLSKEQAEYINVDQDGPFKKIVQVLGLKDTVTNVKKINKLENIVGRM